MQLAPCDLHPNMVGTGEKSPVVPITHKLVVPHAMSDMACKTMSGMAYNGQLAQVGDALFLPAHVFG